jgi:hypothetical protein
VNYQEGSFYALHENNRKFPSKITNPVFIPIYENFTGYANKLLNKSIYVLPYELGISLYDANDILGIVDSSNVGGRLASNLGIDFYKTNYTHYHKEAYQLELDRVIGCGIAESLGLNVPKFFRVTTEGELQTLAYTISLGKYAIKFNKKHFITILDVTCPQDLLNLKHLLEVDSLFIQEYISEQSKEINYCFITNGSGFECIGKSVETNRLLANETGAKVGNSTCFMEMLTEDNTPSIFTTDTFRENIPKYLRGWFDISFMEKDGELYFIEFMVRTGCSNFAVYVNNLACNWFDTYYRFLETGEFTPQYYANKVAGLDIFSFNAGVDTNEVIVDCPENFYGIDAQLYDESNYDGRYLLCEEFVKREGVLCGYGKSYKKIMNKLIDQANKNFRISSLCWREVTKEATFKPLLKTLKRG